MSSAGVMLAILVVIKRVATGSILEKPHPRPLLWLVNIFSLFFLLIVNALAAIVHIGGQLEGVDPSSVEIDSRWLLDFIELGG